MKNTQYENGDRKQSIVKNAQYENGDRKQSIVKNAQKKGKRKMKLEMYMIHDTLAGNYHLPHLYFHNDQEAQRAFTEMLTNEKCEFSKHPEDMEMIHVGTIDIETGEHDIKRYLTNIGDKV